MALTRRPLASAQPAVSATGWVAAEAASSPRYSEDERKRVAAVVFATVLFDYLAVGMMRSALPWYATKLGGGAVLLGLLETSYGVGQVIGASFLGRLSDTEGRRFVLILSCFGSALGYGIASVAATATVLVASRVPVGLAKQTVTVARAILADISVSPHLFANPCL